MIRAGTRNRSGFYVPLMCLATEEIGGVPLDCEAFAQTFDVTIEEVLGLTDATTTSAQVLLEEPIGLTDATVVDAAVLVVDALGLTDAMTATAVLAVLIDCARVAFVPWSAEIDTEATWSAVPDEVVPYQGTVTTSAWAATVDLVPYSAEAEILDDCPPECC